MTNAIPIPENFPVTWDDPQDANLTWHQESTHCPEPVPALAADFWHSVWAGMDRAMQHYQSPTRPLLRCINNYIYMADKKVVPPDAEEAASQRTQQAQEAFAANLQQHWDEDFLPQIQDYIDRWDRFDLARATTAQLRQHFDASWDWLGQTWVLHFRLFPGNGRGQFAEYYKELFGADNTTEENSDPHDHTIPRLLQGQPTRTTEMGRALWALSRQIPPQIARLITACQPTRDRLQQSAQGQAFLAGLDAFLKAYGHRGNHWGIQYPTWIEDPTPVLEMLRGYLTHPETDPTAAFEAQAVEQEQTLAQVRTRLQGLPQVARDRFEALLTNALTHAILKEDHNFWIDFSCTSRVRRIMLEIGRRLAGIGVLETASDILHLHLDEIRALLAASPPADQRARVTQRKASLAHFSAIEPPPRLGVEPLPPDTPDTPPPAPPGLLRGTPGAPGTARGRARLVLSPTTAPALDCGDILVARSTAPSLTPLFATAGGMITETGGPLSHCAVVAREYRIPAVVNLADARSHIKEGQQVEIDGTAGIVRLVEEAADRVKKK